MACCTVSIEMLHILLTKTTLLYQPNEKVIKTEQHSDQKIVLYDTFGVSSQEVDKNVLALCLTAKLQLTIFDNVIE